MLKADTLKQTNIGNSFLLFTYTLTQHGPQQRP